MKIDYVTIGNASNVHNWSGLEYNIAQSLENYVGEVNYIGDLKINESFSSSLKRKAYRIIGQRIDPVRELFFARQCSEQVGSRLSPDTHVVFSPGTVATALLRTDKPKVIYSDVSFAGYSSSYYSGFSSSTIKNGNFLEQKALESASLSLFSSEYGARTAIENYNIDPGKVKVVPFGANIRHSFSRDTIKEIVQRRSIDECHLLFLGVDWIRKGGDMAVKIVKILNKIGIKTVLHVAGIKKIPLKPLPDYIKDHGFISKSSQKGEEELIKLISSCHFLLLPTKAEAYGLVFCEANSLGVPAITTNVGGIPTIIKNNVNGRMFDLDQGEKEYARYIASTFTDRGKYLEMALASYNEYYNRLNWKAAGKKIAQLLETL